MRNFSILFVVAVLLSGCVKETPVSETIAQNAVNATTALEQGLSDECKTDSIKTQITVIKSEIRTISNACQTEKEQITQEKLRWKWSFWGLVAVIGIFLARRY